MNKKKRFAISLALTMTMGCVFSMTAAAEDITYNSNISDSGKLKSDPRMSGLSALFSDNSLSNNRITVNLGDRTELLDARVYGGISTSDQPAVVSGNSLQIDNSTIKYEVYGGYSKNGTVHDNHVTM